MLFWGLYVIKQLFRPHTALKMVFRGILLLFKHLHNIFISCENIFHFVNALSDWIMFPDGRGQWVVAPRPCENRALAMGESCYYVTQEYGYVG